MIIPDLAYHFLPGKRNLEAEYKPEVSEIFAINFKIHSDVDLSAIRHDLIITNWTSTQVIMQLNLEVPTTISRGVIEDELELNIVRPEIFEAKRGDFVLEYEDSFMVSPIPR